MDARETFEDRVSRTLDVLFDGASLLTREPRRAEDLVVSVVVDAARRYTGLREQREFRKWIVGRLVKQYLEFAGAADTERLEEAGPDEAADVRVPATRAAAGEGHDALFARLSFLDRRDPEKLDRIIRESMEELPLVERAAVWLVGALDFSYGEAAAILGVPVRELRGTLFRARRELQARVSVALQGETPGGRRTGREGGGHGGR